MQIRDFISLSLAAPVAVLILSSTSFISCYSANSVSYQNAPDGDSPENAESPIIVTNPYFGFFTITWEFQPNADSANVLVGFRVVANSYQDFGGELVHRPEQEWTADADDRYMRIEFNYDCGDPSILYTVTVTPLFQAGGGTTLGPSSTVSTSVALPACNGGGGGGDIPCTFGSSSGESTGLSGRGSGGRSVLSEGSF